jgi:hypothetical protein
MCRFGIGSRSFQFSFNDKITLVFDVDWREAARIADCSYLQEKDANCAITFFRNKTMVHKPFLIKLDPNELMFGVWTSDANLDLASRYISANALEYKKTL